MDTQGSSTDKSGNLKVTVDELIAAPFSTRSQADKEKIVSGGRPMTCWDLSNHIMSENEIKKDHGGRSVFDAFQWLTTSVTTCKFHCWPCLLFRPPGVVNETNILSFGQLKEHERSSEHMESLFRFQIFVSQNSEAARVETLGTNSEALRRLADVVCSLAALQKTPEADSCLEIMEFLRIHDGVNKCYSDDAIKLLNGTPKIVDRIVKAVAKVTRRNVARMVRASQYVSLILGRHPEKKISSILRYVRNGKVEERFLGFSRVSGSASVYKHVKRLIDELDIGSKCVALSLDGGLLDPADWDRLFAKLKKDAPHCTFAPWHSQAVDFAWHQSLSVVDPKCKKFFQCLSALEGYFRDSAYLCAAMDDFAPETGLRDVLGGRPTKDFLSCVHRNRLRLVQFFDAVLSDGTRWDADHVARAVGCREFLRDGTTTFLLDVFARMSRLAAPLKTALGSYVPERRFSEGMASDLVGELRSVQDQDCRSLLNSQEQSAEEDSCIQLFDNIMERAIAEVQARYGDLEKFQFCCLFDFLEEGWYQQSAKYLHGFNKCYDLNINPLHALSELAVLEHHGAFSKTSVYDFHQYLHDSHLKHTFKSLFDLSELVLAMPFKQTSLERETSVWDKISKWSADPGFSKACDDSYFLFVESDYLLEIKKVPYFYYEVCAAVDCV